jgi:uncharacterized protein YcbK (DUF882 family)
LIDRRRILGWGLGTGAGLLAPGAALAAARRHAHHHPRHAHMRHEPARHDGPVRYEALAHEPLPVMPVSTAPRRLSFKNLHTDESLDAVYWEDGKYVPDALDAVNHVLRDFRTGESHPIEPRLLDVLVDLQKGVDSRSAFQVISGYRSPATNAMLSEQSAEVAKHSLHMDGLAIDLYLDDVDLQRLHEAALDLSRGGVGYYPQSKFVHLDVGPVRRWQGV